MEAAINNLKVQAAEKRLTSFGKKRQKASRPEHRAEAGPPFGAKISSLIFSVVGRELIGGTWFGRWRLNQADRDIGDKQWFSRIAWTRETERPVRNPGGAFGAGAPPVNGRRGGGVFFALRPSGASARDRGPW